MAYRVVIGRISHESNSFSPVRTGIEAFGADGIPEGQEVFAHHRGTRTAIGGFMDLAGELGLDLIPTLAAHAVPSAPVAAAAFAWMKGRLLDGIRAARTAGRVDGLLLDLHGAMLAEGLDGGHPGDGDGDILRACRDLVGPGVPIVCVLDLHANLTRAMVGSSDALVIYRTNPHVDMYERGVEAARLLGGVLDGRIRPVQALAKPPMLPPTINQRTGEGPMVALLARAAQWEGRAGILRVGVAPAFPYNDFGEAGLGVVAVADGDAALARQAADDVAALAWELRGQFLKRLPEPDAALADAMGRAARPVVLADVADNPGGGGTGDTTAVLRTCLDAGVRDAMAWIHDPDTVARAFAAGVGGEAEFALGGRVEPAFGAPVRVCAYVHALSDGRFVLRGPQSTGMRMGIGRTAVLLVGGQRVEDSFAIVASELRTAPNDAEIFRFVGLEPSRARLLLIKSRGHFRASFEPLAAGGVIEVDAPGAASPDLARFPYRAVPRPIFPLDPM